MNGKNSRPARRRAMLVVAATVAMLGVAAGPAAAKPKVCGLYAKTFALAQEGFMAGYDSWNQSEMDYWLGVYEDAINGAEAAGC